MVDRANETAHAGSHASRATYWLIALVLGILTLLEVAVFYVPLLHAVIVPILLVLSTAKFALVAMYYMHLRFDHRWFSYMFVGPLVIAVIVVVSLLWLFGHIGSTGPRPGTGG